MIFHVCSQGGSESVHYSSVFSREGEKEGGREWCALVTLLISKTTFCLIAISIDDDLCDGC